MRHFALNFLSLRLCSFYRHVKTVDGSASRRVWKFVEVLTICGNVENFAADGCSRGCGCEAVPVPIEFVGVGRPVVWAARARLRRAPTGANWTWFVREVGRSQCWRCSEGYLATRLLTAGVSCRKMLVRSGGYHDGLAETRTLRVGCRRRGLLRER